MIRRAAALVVLLAVTAALAPLVAAPDPAPPESGARDTKPAPEAAKPDPGTAKPAPPTAKPAPAAPQPATVAPTALAATASPAAALAQPANPPFVVPKPTGKMEIPAGQQKFRVEAQVSKDRPTSYTYTSPGGNQSFWVGVSSPKNDVYMSVFDYETKQPIAGTLPADRAARILLSFQKPTELLFVAHTVSAGTPFRFEITLGGMSL